MNRSAPSLSFGHQKTNKIEPAKKKFPSFTTRKIRREKTLEHMFLYSKNMANIEAFRFHISSSINLVFMNSVSLIKCILIDGSN